MDSVFLHARNLFDFWRGHKGNFERSGLGTQQEREQEAQAAAVILPSGLVAVAPEELPGYGFEAGGRGRLGSKRDYLSEGARAAASL